MFLLINILLILCFYAICFYLQKYITKFNLVIKVFRLSNDDDLHHIARKAKRLIASELAYGVLWIILALVLGVIATKLDQVNAWLSNTLMIYSGTSIFDCLLVIAITLITYLVYRNKEEEQ